MIVSAVVVKKRLRRFFDLRRRDGRSALELYL
jgi:hypothetical protein